MLTPFLRRERERPGLWRGAAAAAVLLLAFYLGRNPSRARLGLVLAAGAALALIRRPALGLVALVAAALVVPLEFGTGTEVRLNAATLLVPALLVLWLAVMLRRGAVRLAPARANLPLALFLLAGLFSLLIGYVLWDPMVYRPANFTLVQLAQWAIFAFSAGAFWLTANLADDRELRRLTAAFLLIGGAVAAARLLPGAGRLAARVSTAAFIRAPFWVLLAALAGGQLLFNRRLSGLARLSLLGVLAAVGVYAFVQQQEAASNWVGVLAVAATLVWLRFPRLRLPLVLLVVALTVAGVLFPALYNFAGGEREWNISGGSRLALIERVVEVTMRNPITGLGPAAYRPYTRMVPLRYGNTYWVDPRVNSHNNYVDLFSQTGVVGLALFAWFCAAVAGLGVRLHRRYRGGFAAGYVNGMLAAGVASLAIMALADWILPFVYNIGFPGFQASVLVWLFLGGLVALDGQGDDPTERAQAGGSG